MLCRQKYDRERFEKTTKATGSWEFVVADRASAREAGTLKLTGEATNGSTFYDKPYTCANPSDEVHRRDGQVARHGLQVALCTPPFAA